MFLLNFPNAEVVWEDASGNDGISEGDRPSYWSLYSGIDGVRTTSDEKIVVVQTRGSDINNPDYKEGL